MISRDSVSLSQSGSPEHLAGKLLPHVASNRSIGRTSQHYCGSHGMSIVPGGDARVSRSAYHIGPGKRESLGRLR